jgi:hypothetical protein
MPIFKSVKHIHTKSSHEPGHMFNSHTKQYTQVEPTFLATSEVSYSNSWVKQLVDTKTQHWALNSYPICFINRCRFSNPVSVSCKVWKIHTQVSTLQISESLIFINMPNRQPGACAKLNQKIIQVLCRGKDVMRWLKHQAVSYRF